MSRGKKNYAQHERELNAAIGRLGELRESLKAAVDADAAAYSALVAALKAAKTQGAAEVTGPQPDVQEATRGAARVPLSVAEQAREVEQIAEALRPITNPKMASDLTTAIALAAAARAGAVANVEINLEGFSDAEFVQEARARLGALAS